MTTNATTTSALLLSTQYSCLCSHICSGQVEESPDSVLFYSYLPNEPLSKDRVEAFSDGVYAIVATLLILDIWFVPLFSAWDFSICDASVYRIEVRRLKHQKPVSLQTPLSHSIRPVSYCPVVGLDSQQFLGKQVNCVFDCHGWQ